LLWFVEQLDRYGDALAKLDRRAGTAPLYLIRLVHGTVRLSWRQWTALRKRRVLRCPLTGICSISITPQPVGAPFVHTYVMSMVDLNRGTYSGQFGFVYIETKNNSGRYDQEVFLATHEFEPFFGAEEMEEQDE
jgi:hypothetical protein